MNMDLFQIDMLCWYAPFLSLNSTRTLHVIQKHGNWSLTGILLALPGTSKKKHEKTTTCKVPVFPAFPALEFDHPEDGLCKLLVSAFDRSNLTWYTGKFGVCRFHQTILNYQTCFTLFDLMFSVSHFNFILHVRLQHSTIIVVFLFPCFRIKGWKLWSGHWANSLLSDVLSFY